MEITKDTLTRTVYMNQDKTELLYFYKIKTLVKLNNTIQTVIQRVLLGIKYLVLCHLKKFKNLMMNM